MPLLRGQRGAVAHPLRLVLRDLSKDIERAGDRFGMNPLSRFRLQFTVAEVGKSLEDLMRRKAPPIHADTYDDEDEIIDLSSLGDA